MDKKYEKLLDKAIKELPEVVQKTERFEIPKIKGHVQGNKTILSNFHQIADVLHRDPKHILKFITKELATRADMKKSGAVMLVRKVAASRINEKIQKYADNFVICYECRKHDTKIMKEGKIEFLKCLACGARRSIHSLK